MNVKKGALFKEKFDLVDNAFKLFGFKRSVSNIEYVYISKLSFIIISISAGV